jgi:hypothetical protein
MADDQDARREPPASGLADPTRDIRLPPLPGTSPPELPPEWREHVPSGADRRDDVLADQPTDQLTSPPRSAPDRTLTFDGQPSDRWAAGHPATVDPAVPRTDPVASAVPRRSRRWPWVVLTLVPLLVIVVTGVWLLVLMNRG